MSTFTAPIDLVYLYVNSSDEEWVNKRNQYAMDHNNSACRFRDNHELMYSLRSVEKYAPWIRNIYIISNSAMPDWLNTNHPKLHIVEHEDIMPPNILPCFNSNVIESYLYKIPGLSEIFLYANDDMFFGNAVSPDFFVKDGKPIVRMIKKAVTPDSYYNMAILNSKKIVFDYYGKEYPLVPWHNIDVYTKTGIENCKKDFAKEFEIASHNNLRAENDIQRVIFHYHLLIHNSCILKVYNNSSLPMLVMSSLKKLFLPSKYIDYLFCTIHNIFSHPFIPKILLKHPKCACVNDSEQTTEEELRQYPIFMEKMFPERSSFEHSESTNDAKKE